MIRAASIRLRRFASTPRYAPFFVAQNWRIGSGIVLFTFVLLHFLNHALGIFGVGAMEAMQVWRRALWRSTPGTWLLYGAAAIHVTLAVRKILSRTTWRMPWREAVQIAFGLTIPLMVQGHVAATRGIATTFGVDDTYTHNLRLLWPGYGWWQSILLLVVWTHAMIGFHGVLSSRPWFAKWRDAFFAGALLVPALALAGWISAGRAVRLLRFETFPVTREQFLWHAGVTDTVEWIILAVFAAMVVVIVLAVIVRANRRRITVTYLGGRQVRTPPGPTLLEISRAAGVPHASVCGGRARCSTCRVRVAAGGKSLPAPAERERKVLARISAPEGVRLACSITPQDDISVETLVSPDEAVKALGASDASRWGVERQVSVLFADLRGFTTLSEKHLAFDVVFLLNRYLTLMTEAVERHGGEVDKFLGDGVLALFGTRGLRDQGSRAALAAAHDMFAALDVLNGEFVGLLAESLRMGVGIHTGPVILGRVGAAGSASGLTALGDTVNTASRLQDACKTLGVTLVVSEATLSTAGVTLGPETRHEILVRGRQGEMVVHALDGHQPVLAATAVAA